ncbi:MAG: AbgT family transporter [Treponema sp.]|nr:AbgT family transporter [Treponema sp.]
METKENTVDYGLKIGRRTFLGALGLLLCIMVLAGILTQVIPRGLYQYEDLQGRKVIVPGTYRVLEGGSPLPVWRWFTAPFEVFGEPAGVTAVSIMIFIMLLVGSFLVLEHSSILPYLIHGVIHRFGGKKYRLLAIMVLICMAMGSFLGLLEETVTLVPITIALSLMLGWDSLVGVGMSVLSVGFGFAAGTFNLFTIGLAQKLAELPLFSGILFRLIFFGVTYGVMLLFLIPYAKKVEAHPEKSPMFDRDEPMRRHYQDSLKGERTYGPEKKRGLIAFLAAMILVFCYIIASFFVNSLSDYVMPVMAIAFTGGSLIAGRIAGLRWGNIGKTFFKGIAGILPSLLLILLAVSVTHIMEQGKIIDTILHFFYEAVEGFGPYAGAAAIFVLVLFLELFMAGASAKAFLLMPIIVPLADLIGITRQTAVQAFSMGDGFTNMLYPTNVLLIIILGIANIPYSRWFRWIRKPILALLALSALALFVAVAIRYGPY